MLLIDTYHQYLNVLQHHYARSECESIFRYVASELLPWHPISLVQHGDRLLTTRQQRQFDRALRLLCDGMPVQYVTRTAYFAGLKLKVSPAVLIPRPETEELLCWVVDDLKGREEPINVLDVGTGSGCLALGVKKMIAHATVYATDVSSACLRVARENARQTNLPVLFRRHDILQRGRPFPRTFFHVVVSNPPYVLAREKASLPRQVRAFEPKLALCVPDEDPLLYYRKMLDKWLDDTQAKPIFYFEINPAMYEALQQWLHHLGVRFTFRRDLSGNWRMLRVVHKNSALSLPT